MANDQLKIKGCRDLAGAGGLRGCRGHAAKPQTRTVECRSRHKDFLILHKTAANGVDAIVVQAAGGRDKHRFSCLVLLGPLGANLGGRFAPAYQWATTRTKSIYT